LSNSSDPNYIGPIVDDFPEENSNNYQCGWFLKWFHLIVFDYKSSNDFHQNYLLPLFKLEDIVFDDDTDIEAKDDKTKEPLFDKETKSLILIYRKAKLYSTAWRTRWLTFFRHLWNHPFINRLIDVDVPHSTKVNGTSNGFNYIVKVIAENIFQKVFYGEDILPEVTFRSQNNILTKVKNKIVILSKTGYLVIIILIISINKDLEELVRKQILDMMKTKRQVNKKKATSSKENADDNFVSAPLVSDSSDSNDENRYIS